jgi:hypothetical protein
VTQLLNLLELHVDILDFVRSLPKGTPDRLVTEKQLRRLRRIDADAQLETARKVLSGFGGYLARQRQAVG